MAGARTAPEQPARPSEPAKPRPSAIQEVTESTEPGASPKALLQKARRSALGSDEEFDLYGAVSGRFRC